MEPVNIRIPKTKIQKIDEIANQEWHYPLRGNKACTDNLFSALRKRIENRKVNEK